MTHWTCWGLCAKSCATLCKAWSSQSPTPCVFLYATACLFKVKTISETSGTMLFHTDDTFAMLQFPVVASALAINASVWDAFTVLMFYRNNKLGGIACGLATGAFQTLAMCTMQPHALAALNGVGVVLCLFLSVDTITARRVCSFILVVLGSVVGLLGIQRRSGNVVIGYKSVLYFFLAAYFVLLFTPLRCFLARGSAQIKESKLKFQIAAADGCLAISSTTLLMHQSMSRNYWDLVVVCIVGCVSLATTWFSLQHNSVKTHLIIVYPLWSFGLIAADFSGGYNVDPVYLAVQFGATAAGIYFSFV